MSNNAVKLYGNVSTEEKDQNNLTGIPDQWPQEILAIGDSTELPDASYQLMTDAEVVSHIAANQAAYNAWKAAKNAVDMSKVIGDKIQKAMDFGKKIMIEYGTKNVMRGYNVEQTRAVALKSAELQALLLSGSLYCARQAIIDMEPDALVTQADKDEFLTKINSYLGL